MPTLLLGLGLLIASHLLTLAAALLLGAAVSAGGPLAGAVAVGLLLVPPPLLAGLLPRRAITVPLCMGLWSLAILIALPAALPYPAAQAIDAGFGLIGGGCPAVGRLAYTILPDLSGTAALAGVTPPAPPDCPPAAAAAATATATAGGAEPLAVSALASMAGPGDVVIPYTSEGSAIIIPVSFEGARGVVTLPMLFDTGATLTTLNRASLAEVGLTIAPDAPEITSQTAGGERKSRVTLSPGLAVGGHRVEGVTISQCEPCADAKSRGLLGMDVSGRFLITIDTRAQQLILRPREGGETRDIEPWLRISADGTRTAAGQIEMDVSVHNSGDRPVALARVQIQCGVEVEVDVRAVPPRGSASTHLALPEGATCAAYLLSLAEALW